MNINLETTHSTKINTLTNFIPKALSKKSLYEASILSKSKKEVELEIKSLTLFQTYSYVSLLKSLENRFWFYGKSLPNPEQSYSLCFKSFDNMLFSDRINKLTELSPLTHALNARQRLLNDQKKVVLFKSRLLCVTKSGFKFSFYGLRAVLNRRLFELSKIEKRFKTEKKSDYISWLILNLSSIGLLSSFRIANWKLSHLKLSKKVKKNFLNYKSAQYLKGSFGFKSQISLSRN